MKCKVGFLSFHLNYYEKELQRLEYADANEASIYHARQLLKILDDLLDEGYTALNDALSKHPAAAFRGCAIICKGTAQRLSLPHEER